MRRRYHFTDDEPIAPAVSPTFEPPPPDPGNEPEYVRELRVIFEVAVAELRDRVGRTAGGAWSFFAAYRELIAGFDRVMAQSPADPPVLETGQPAPTPLNPAIPMDQAALLQQLIEARRRDQARAQMPQSRDEWNRLSPEAQQAAVARLFSLQQAAANEEAARQAAKRDRDAYFQLVVQRETMRYAAQPRMVPEDEKIPPSSETQDWIRFSDGRFQFVNAPPTVNPEAGTYAGIQRSEEPAFRSQRAPTFGGIRVETPGKVIPVFSLPLRNVDEFQVLTFGGPDGDVQLRVDPRELAENEKEVFDVVNRIQNRMYAELAKSGRSPPR